MKGDFHVRFRENVRVKFPCVTRLQNLRAGGTLPYRKLGGSMYYRREDIRKMMEGGNGNG